MDKFKEYYFKHKTSQIYAGVRDICRRRDIKCLITLNEIRKLWIRNNAFNMERPSINRIDDNGNYEFKNCKLVEVKESMHKALGKPVDQYDCHYNFIKTYPSIKEASIAMDVSYEDIRKCCNYEVDKVDNFYWHFNKETS